MLALSTLARCRLHSVLQQGAALRTPVAQPCRWMSSKILPPLTGLSGRNPNPPGHMPRAERITMQHVGHSFMVHNGKAYKQVKCTTQMVDHKFGEFVLTRNKPPAFDKLKAKQMASKQKMR